MAISESSSESDLVLSPIPGSVFATAFHEHASDIDGQLLLDPSFVESVFDGDGMLIDGFYTDSSFASFLAPTPALQPQTLSSPLSLSDESSSSQTTLVEENGQNVPVNRQRRQRSARSPKSGPTERMLEITPDELACYYAMPITEASKKLKVGLTVLKKRCREFGIPRWPHRKLKSLDGLIHNIQELSKESPSSGKKKFEDAVSELEVQKRNMQANPAVDLSDDTKRLRQACFKQSYKQRRQALARLEEDDEE
ncbi:protein RKD2-like [Selaginella moellendorffii]|uniref:protein RKD2-like n=1 Tax=Selaginella moellendorffii TaxID=88036 RepID=UPI000D1CB999|nr:protein RKD2-like [Selaginella moellendorffii]|eukprot:XP_024522950.1 protein RKD2-like [Selaginella moellendorffii]